MNDRFWESATGRQGPVNLPMELAQ